MAKARSIDCRCEYNFTCGHCCKEAAIRNKAELNATPPEWRRIEELRTTYKERFPSKRKSLTSASTIG